MAQQTTFENLNLLTDDEIAQLNQLVAEANNIIICCHKSPDGDAIGSSLGWAEILSSHYGKTAQVIVPDAYPDFLQWIPCSERIIRYDKHPERCDLMFQTADLVFCLDFNTTSRVAGMEPILVKSTAKRVLIDHHLNPDVPAILTISHPQMSSTAELVFRIAWQLGAYENMSRHAAAQIYTGMMTDTGAFTFNSTRPEIYFMIGQLLAKGIDKDTIYRKVYNNYSAWALRLRGYVIYQKMNYFEDLHAAYFTITRDDMQRFHFKKGDAEGLVNEPLKIKGTRLSISLREDDRVDNLIWVSMRSIGDLPSNVLCQRYFNGGGHLNASGGRLECTIEEAEQRVREMLQKEKDLLK